MTTGAGGEPEQVREPDDQAVLRRLAELEIPLEVLTHAIWVGHTKGDFATTAHPRTYHGLVVWGELTGELRGGLLGLGVGWQLDDTDNIARAISPDGKVIIVAVRGNEHTGMRSKYEQLSTRRPRGNAGVRIIKMNTQLELTLQDGASDRDRDLVGNLGGTWFLLYNRVGDFVRSELSFARSVKNDGKLLKWKERLILPDIDLLLTPPIGKRDDDTTPPEVDVPVTLRAS